LGRLCDSDFFAGRVLREPIPGGALWGCGDCRSMFRHPVLSDEVYQRWYSEGAADGWAADERRNDVALIRQLIRARTAARVLDVGCGSGDFLAALPPSVGKFGVEPSLAAAQLARTRGVSVLAATLDGLPPTMQFDFVTMIDVIEHVADPAQLLDATLPHLLPGGSLIIATGNAEHALWRKVFKSRFWYSSFPEHISFPSLEFFDRWRKTRGLNRPSRSSLKYRRQPTRKNLLTLGAQLAYFASPAAWHCICRSLAVLQGAPDPRQRFFSPAGPGLFTDHCVVTIQRPM
jgi:SAM-dependent methyltransferase